jgi:hypothetical protein
MTRIAVDSIRTGFNAVPPKTGLICVRPSALVAASTYAPANAALAQSINPALLQKRVLRPDEGQLKWPSEFL